MGYFRVRISNAFLCAQVQKFSKLLKTFINCNTTVTNDLWKSTVPASWKFDETFWFCSFRPQIKSCTVPEYRVGRKIL